jgi:hypothetical protein
MSKIANIIIFYTFVISILIIIVMTIMAKIKLFFGQKKINSYSKNEMAKILITKSKQYSYAAEQDKDILNGLLHANYSVCYLSAAKDIFSESTLANLFTSPEEYKLFEKNIIKIQDNINIKAIDKCSKITKNKQLLARIGGYN